MISLALNYYFSGIDPFPYKIVNLAIHILSGISLFFLGQLLMRALPLRHRIHISKQQSKTIALVAALLWLIHPIQLTPILYVVQRMATLAGLFSILALITYSQGRIHNILHQRSWPFFLACILIWFPAAVFSKESGLLIPVYCLTIEIIFFNFRTAQYQQSKKFLHTITILSSIATVFSIHFLLSHYKSSYDRFDFDMPERLMTESRAIWLYLKLIIIPNLSELSLFHDDFAISRSLIDPPSTRIAITGILLLITTVALTRKKQPLIAFAILFFLAGHLLESTIVALEPVFEHRNYLAIYGITLCITFYLLRPFQGSAWKLLSYAAIIAITAWLANTSYQRAILWSDPDKLLTHWLLTHPKSAKVAMWAADSYQQAIPDAPPQQAQAYRQMATHYFEKAIQAQPSLCSALVGILMLPPQNDNITNNIAIRAQDCARNQAMQPGTSYALQELTQALVTKTLDLPENVIHGLFTSALNNPGNTGPSRLMTLSAYGAYLGDKQHSWSIAAAILKEATDQNPSHAILWLQYARYAAHAGLTDIALQAIAQAKSRDTGTLSTAINKIYRLIRQPAE